MNTTQQNKQKSTIFNNRYEIVSKLGDGISSVVFLVRDLKESNKLYALKHIKPAFLSNNREYAISKVCREYMVQKEMNHMHINKVLEFGTEGEYILADGRKCGHQVYILLEYVEGDNFFNICQKGGQIGEKGAKFFFLQLLDAINYMHNTKNTCHCDLKPENILLDRHMNIQIADFGLASDKNIERMTGMRGTFTYTAPEIIDNKTYDGRKSDIFSLAVILFVMANGKFPFRQALKTDLHYGLMLEGDLENYWKVTGATKMSPKFRDLFQKMVAQNPDDRLSIEEIYSHPWMQEDYYHKLAHNHVYKIANQAPETSDDDQMVEDSKHSKQSNHQTSTQENTSNSNCSTDGSPAQVGAKRSKQQMTQQYTEEEDDERYQTISVNNKNTKKLKPYIINQKQQKRQKTDEDKYKITVEQI